MKRIDKLEQNVKTLYEKKNPDRADWADWLADNHVFVVADYASELSERFGADGELARAAALLHDIADAKMKRNNPEHAEESLRMARELLHEAGYDEAEVNLVVDDAIRFHSCRDDNKPSSLEGKILAAADSMAHLKTDFYVYTTYILGKDHALQEVKKWVLNKIDRDFHVKILFDEIRDEVAPDYEIFKELFSR